MKNIKGWITIVAISAFLAERACRGRCRAPQGLDRCHRAAGFAVWSGDQCDAIDGQRPRGDLQGRQPLPRFRECGRAGRRAETMKGGVCGADTK